MCDKSRSISSLGQKLVGLIDIETASFAYHGEIDKAKASAVLASVFHDALVKYNQSICKAETKDFGNGWNYVETSV